MVFSWLGVGFGVEHCPFLFVPYACSFFLLMISLNRTEVIGRYLFFLVFGGLY